MDATCADINLYIKNESDLRIYGQKILDKIRKEICDYELELSGQNPDSSMGKIFLELMKHYKAMQAFFDRHDVVENSYKDLLRRHAKLWTRLEHPVQLYRKLLTTKEILVENELINVLSSSIRTALNENYVDIAVIYFSKFSSVIADMKLQSRKAQYIDQLKVYYHKLEDIIVSDFKRDMKALGWPFLSSQTRSASTSLNFSKDVSINFALTFHRLCQLKLPQFKDIDDEEPDMYGEISLPIKIMLEPLQQRFYFHFYGNRKTNTLSKPEWFFTQINAYIQSHEVFFTHILEPALENTESSKVNCLEQFIRGLINLLIEKLNSNYDAYISNDLLFCRVVDEIILFENEMKEICNYGGSAQIMSVLESSSWFEKWMQLESKFARNKIEKLLLSVDTWGSTSEDSKRPECCDSFIALLCAITGRIHCLTNCECQTRFCNVLIDLLYEFQSIITSNFRPVRYADSHSTDNFHLQFDGPGEFSRIVDTCQVLSCLYYVKQRIELWADDELFYSLWMNPFCKSILKDSKQSTDVSEKHWVAHANSIEFDYELLRTSNIALDCIFHDVLQCYIRVTTTLIHHLLHTARMMITDALEGYRTKNWGHHSLCGLDREAFASQSHCNANEQDFSLSEQIFYVIKTVQNVLHHFDTKVDGALFNLLFRSVAKILDSMLFNELILKTRFNQVAAYQLRYDINNGLIPLFSAYTSSASFLFCTSVEACRLLCLNTGSYTLLLDLLQATGSNSLHMEDPIGALLDIGVASFTPEEAVQILQKIDTTQ